MKKLSILFALSTLTVQAMAAVPNTFVAGTPAKASEVNTNFAYLDNQINNVCASFRTAGPNTYTYTATNLAAGTVINLNVGGVSTPFTMLSFPIYDQSTGKRYAVKIPYNSNIYISIHNTEVGCNGNATISGFPAMIGSLEFQSISRGADGSYVYKNGYTGNEVDIKVGSTLVQIETQSSTESIANGTDNGTPFDLTDDISASAQSTRMTAAILEMDAYIDRIIITEI